MKNEKGGMKNWDCEQCVHFYVAVRCAFFNLTSSFLILN